MISSLRFTLDLRSYTIPHTFPDSRTVQIFSPFRGHLEHCRWFNSTRWLEVSSCFKKTLSSSIARRNPTSPVLLFFRTMGPLYMDDHSPNVGGWYGGVLARKGDEAGHLINHLLSASGKTADSGWLGWAYCK